MSKNEVQTNKSEFLQSISKIVESDDTPFEEILRGVVSLIPGAWKFPDIACARVTANGQEYRTAKWKDTIWKQTSELILRGERVGIVEVCYLDEKPSAYEGPFLRDERELLDNIAECLNGLIKRRRTEEELRRSEEKYRSLYSTMSEGVAVHQMLYNQAGEPIDYVITDVNLAFEAIFGLSKEKIIGRRGGDVYAADRPPFLRTFAKVISSGKPISVETYYKPKEKYFSISAFSPEKGKFATVFADTTRFKLAEKELERSRERIIEAQELLRKEIAQQLHGTVQNRLIVLLNQMTMLAKQIPEPSATELNSMRKTLENLLESEVRSISHRLYPSILRYGLAPGLHLLGDHFSSTINVDVKIDIRFKEREGDNLAATSERVKLVAYRIAEESLINCIKHANASNSVVELEMLGENQMKLSIKDNGCGFNMDQKLKGLGIAIMQDYAEVIGGRCTVSSAPGRGTTITAILPLSEHVAEH